MIKTLTRLVLAAAASLAFVSGGHATDLDVGMPLDNLVPEDFDWSGVYAGVQAGFVGGTDALAETPGAAYSSTFGLGGATGGVYAGANMQQGDVVFGVEADAELSGVSGSDTAWTFGDSITARISAQGALRARLGYAADKTLFYVAGGVALANIETEYVDGGAVDSYAKLVPGVTIGAGVEQALNDTWIARIDYRYTRYARITDATDNSEPTWHYNNDIATHAVRFGIGAKY